MGTVGDAAVGGPGLYPRRGSPGGEMRRSGERSGDAMPAEGRRAAKAGPQPVARVLLAGAVLQPGPGGGRLWSMGPGSGTRV